MIYPVGLLVFNWALLFSAREAIKSGRTTPLSTAIQFLYIEYEPLYYWWELAEMLRRFLLVGFFVMVKQGSIEQLVYGTLVSLLYLAAQLIAQPYKSRLDD